MDFLAFFDQDVEIIKPILTEDLLTTEDGGGDILLTYLMKTKNEETIKYVLNFSQKNCPHLLELPDSEGDTIIDYLFIKNKSLKLIKYVFKMKFARNVLSRKSYLKTLFLHENPETVDYCLNFFKDNYPTMFIKSNDLVFRKSEHNIFENLFLKKKTGVIRTVFFFLEENYPLLLQEEITVRAEVLFEFYISY